MLVAEVSFGIDPEVVRSLSQLGVHTLGDVAALPSTAVSTRFGQAGIACHRIARGAPDRRVAPELPTTEWAVGITPEEPIERVDAAAFAARHLAAALHEKLKNLGQTCVRLKVIAELENETRLERVWRTREALTETATADRVRWQLDGWLTGGGAGAIVSLVLEPLELAPPDAVEQLWNEGSSSDGARRVVERVQSTLGTDAVVQPAWWAAGAWGSGWHWSPSATRPLRCAMRRGLGRFPRRCRPGWVVVWRTRRRASSWWMVQAR